MTRMAQLARATSTMTRLTEFDWGLELINVIAAFPASHPSGRASRSGLRR
jgi:hypothetical protein